MNSLYDAGRNSFLVGNIDWVTDDIRVMLVDTDDYVANLATHEFLSAVPAAARIAEMPLENKTAEAGVADADDVTFQAVTGDEAEALVLYQFVTGDADSRLIAYLDQASGLPVIPNSGDISISWSGDAATKIFKL